MSWYNILDWMSGRKKKVVCDENPYISLACTSIYVGLVSPGNILLTQKQKEHCNSCDYWWELISVGFFCLFVVLFFVLFCLFCLFVFLFFLMGFLSCYSLSFV